MIDAITVRLPLSLIVRPAVWRAIDWKVVRRVVERKLLPSIAVQRIGYVDESFWPIDRDPLLVRCRREFCVLAPVPILQW